MFSVERETHDQRRFEDNLPFSNIEMKWGETSSQLPLIDLSYRTIIWLDYDGRLSGTNLDDIRSVISRISSGSVLVITVQCQPQGFDANDTRKVINQLAIDLGEERIDPQLDDSTLPGWGTARLFHQIISDEIAGTLTKRNGVIPVAQRLEYQQIFHFHYQDGARMLTTGGIFYDNGQRSIFNHCGFAELPFVRTGVDPFTIDIPKLTFREIKRLEALMPISSDGSIDWGSIPKSDAEHFIRIYRYFPMFIAADL
jgi:hypothetical protein